MPDEQKRSIELRLTDVSLEDRANSQTAYYASVGDEFVEVSMTRRYLLNDAIPQRLKMTVEDASDGTYLASLRGDLEAIKAGITKRGAS